MLKLIKNELFKIFHKKFIYVMMILCLLGALFMVIGDFVSKSLHLDSLYSFEYDLDAYDLNDIDQARYYASEKTSSDLDKLDKEYKLTYDYNDPRYYYVHTFIYEIIADYNDALYVEKNEEEAEKIKRVYEQKIDFLNHFDAMQLVQEAKDNYICNESFKEGCEDDLLVLNYRLKHEIPYTYASDEIEYLSIYHEEYLKEINKKNFDSYTDKKSSQDIIEQYMVLDYKLKNDLYKVNSDEITSARDELLSVFSSITFLELCVLVVLSSTIINEEFNKGTIKQLLVKPYSRTKILISKIIAITIVSFLFIIYQEIVYNLIYGIYNGNFDYSNVIVYDFNKNIIKEYNIFLYALWQFILILPKYFILMFTTLLISILVNSNALSITIGYGLNVGASILTILDFKKLNGYIFTNCWNLQEYLFGKLPTIQYTSFGKSIIISLITIIILSTLSIVIFKKKDIKNI